MLKDTININTYLNAIIFITLAFFGYIGVQYEKRFDRIEARMESGFSRFEEKLDNLIQTTNQIQINTARIEEKQNFLEYRVDKLENDKNNNGENPDIID